MSSATRRGFLQASAGAATLAAASSSLAASEEVSVALIGCGGRGRGLARSFAELAGVRLAWVCDVDDRRRGEAASEAPGKVQSTPDLREMLDDKSVDAVVVATPDHWHAPAAIMALDHGKHVYVEKPCSHNVREGRLLLEAARRNRRHVQHGTQSRSHDLIVHAVQLLREGAIGKVLVAKAWNVQRRSEIGRAKPSQPPSGFDYDLWVGPAPMVPFQPNRHHYTWHWWRAFGTGDMGNDGVHELDIARWGLGVQTHPSLVSAIGGKLVFEDDQQFPDTQYVAFDYEAEGENDRRQLIYEQRLWSRYGLEGVDNGNAFYGTDGWMLLSKRGVLKVFDERNRPKPIASARPKLTSHDQNFIDAVRSDSPLRAEIAEGHLSATLCHLGNTATRLSRSLRFDGSEEKIIDDAQANDLLSREYRKGHFAVPRGV